LNLGWVELLEGNVDGARSCFEEGGVIARRLGIRANVAATVWGLAQTAAAAGDGERAARLAGAAAKLGESAEYDPAVSSPPVRQFEAAREALGETAWHKARADGRELDYDAALELARA
jgi:hypothetical protein